jgi:ORF6N domain
MFILNKKEFADLRSQFVTSGSEQWGGARYMPMVFTEQGVAMLSSVLRSRRAIEVNIAIMSVFVRLREMMAAHKELAVKLRENEGTLFHC